MALATSTPFHRAEPGYEDVVMRKRSPAVAVGYYDEAVRRIFAAAQPGDLAAMDCGEGSLVTSEFEVRACIEELLRAHELSLHERHSLELSKQREHHEHVERLRKHRVMLVQREAQKEKENQLNLQTKDAKQTACDRQVREREQEVLTREKKVAEEQLAVNEKMSDLDTRKLRLDEELRRLEMQKAKLDQRESELAHGKQEEVAKLRQAGDNQQAQLESLREEISAKDEMMAALNKAHEAQLEAVRREAADAAAQRQRQHASEQQKAHEAQLEAVRREAADAAAQRQGQHASEQQKILDMRHEELVSSERGLASKQAELASRESSVAERERATADVVKQVELQCKQCSEREAAISEREAAMRTREQQVDRERQDMLTSKGSVQGDLERLRSSLSAKEREQALEQTRLQEWEKRVSKHTADVEQEQKNSEAHLRYAEEKAEKAHLLNQELTRECCQLRQHLGEVNKKLRAEEAKRAQMQKREEGHNPLDLLIQLGTEAASEFEAPDADEGVSASRFRKSAPPANFGDEVHETHSGARRQRLTARKNIAGVPGVTDFVTPMHSDAGLGVKRHRASVPPGLEAGTWGHDEAPDTKIRALAAADLAATETASLLGKNDSSAAASRKDTSSGFVRPLATSIASAFRIPFGGRE